MELDTLVFLFSLNRQVLFVIPIYRYCGSLIWMEGSVLFLFLGIKRLPTIIFFKNFVLSDIIRTFALFKKVRK